ncbi:hypothetical protein LSTR_LSTR011942 [Laodelphax striatellus]|uniref:Uncharacterized protein n=1 Tax=Laodelphax striatellus TaxID=195883 RepID=A0A482WYP5_LAOST|nr:hypothetical protein LSTR_LSTR011942 [Laodelphax striatellus]
MTTSDGNATDKVRRQVSVPVAQQNRRTAANKTFQLPTFKILQPLQIPTNIYFPFTTRGFGFTTHKIYSIAQQCKTHAISVQQVYRLALFQLENQLTLASDFAYDTPLTQVPAKNLLSDDYHSSIVCNVTSTSQRALQFYEWVICIDPILEAEDKNHLKKTWQQVIKKVPLDCDIVSDVAFGDGYGMVSGSTPIKPLLTVVCSVWVYGKQVRFLSCSDTSFSMTENWIDSLVGVGGKFSLWETSRFPIHSSVNS